MGHAAIGSIDPFDKPWPVGRVGPDGAVNLACLAGKVGVLRLVDVGGESLVGLAGRYMVGGPGPYVAQVGLDEFRGAVALVQRSGA